ncbi:MAG: flippase-like domain-containing protein [Candidatus Dormibacteraeota bacterium]|nr:flippase-like domain-containing protein [Candidatus Dormibacteraeota bacterium]MBV9524658.1 flippase-like domain-containing protein [Candidatus Dormibacteraeota bacterium]
MNRLIGRVIRGVRAAYRALQRVPLLGPVARVLRRHWLAAISVLCLVGLVIGVDPVKLGGVLRHIDWRIALLMVPVTIGCYTARGLAWWVALLRIGARISFMRCLAVEFAGQVLVFLPLGDLARVKLARHSDPGGPGSGRLAGTIVFQELLYMTLIGFGVLARVAAHPDVAVLVVIMTLAHVGIFTILLWQPAYRWALRMVERIHVFRRFDHQLRTLQPTFVELFAPRTFIPVFLLQALSVLGTYTLFFLALQAIGEHHVTFTAAVFVLGLSYILAGLSFVPGGLGAFEGLLTLLMIASGIPAAVGAAAGLLYRAYNDGLMAMVGAVAGLFVRRPERGRRRRRRARAAA